MSECQIKLSVEVYERLLAVAQAEGISPMEWIASRLSLSEPDRYVVKNVSDLIGAIDSQTEPHQTYPTTAFGEALAAKLAKQGIQRP
jgi:hypothetical protein